MIPDPTSLPAPVKTDTSTSSPVAPHILLGAVLLVIVAAITVLAGLHDSIPVVLQALGIADAGALGVAVPAGSG
ncbi:MAG: hypothetical protein ACLQBX_15880 [Candidatus Limnocylindrales bacterium]